MAGPVLSEMAVAVAEAGGLGSLPCALLDAGGMRSQMGIIRQQHRAAGQRELLLPPRAGRRSRARGGVAGAARALLRRARSRRPAPASRVPAAPPFDAEACALVEEFRPEVVSFHFGLPDRRLLARVRATGAKVIVLGHHGRRGALAGGRAAATRSSPRAPRRAGTAACS